MVALQYSVSALQSNLKILFPLQPIKLCVVTLLTNQNLFCTIPVYTVHIPRFPLVERVALSGSQRCWEEFLVLGEIRR
jgi:hypothetical protein